MAPVRSHEGKSLGQRTRPSPRAKRPFSMVSSPIFSSRCAGSSAASTAHSPHRPSHRRQPPADHSMTRLPRSRWTSLRCRHRASLSCHLTPGFPAAPAKGEVGLAACDQRHAAFKRRCIPANSRRFVSFIVALRWRKNSGQASRWGLLPCAPSQPGAPLSALTPLCSQAVRRPRRRTGITTKSASGIMPRSIRTMPRSRCRPGRDRSRIRTGSSPISGPVRIGTAFLSEVVRRLERRVERPPIGCRVVASDRHGVLIGSRETARKTGRAPAYRMPRSGFG